MYDNNMTGALFINKKREKDSQPNARGSCEIDGTEYWVSAWTKTSKAGEKYQSLAFEPKEVEHSAPAPEGAAVLDDDLPF